MTVIIGTRWSNMSDNAEQLKQHILSLSVSKDYSVAKKWFLTNIFYDDCGANCPCGQPIKEICYIKNRLNGRETFVGNVCIKKFLGINTGNAFAGLKRIIQDKDARPNEDLILWAKELGYLYPNDYAFLINIRHKRSLSEKQLSWLNTINYRIKNRKKVVFS